MAEYYPLLAKAVAGLSNPTPEMRRAVYERARKALLAQLLSLEPPLGEADVARETEALDGAVARLEIELGAPNGRAVEKPETVAPAMPTPNVSRGAAPQPTPPPSGMSTPPRRPAGPPTQGVPAPPSKPQGSTPPGPMPAPAERQNPTVSAEAGARASQEGRPAKMPPRPPQKIKAPTAQAAAIETEDGPGVETEAGVDDGPFADLEKPRSEGLRVYAPQRVAEEGRASFRLWIVGGIVGVVVAIVAVAAWTLRDRPSQFAHLKAPALTKPERSGKIVERIGAGDTQQKQNSRAEEPSRSQQVAAPAAVASAAPTRATQTTQATQTSKTSNAGQTIAVAQRAALLVEAPNEPNKVKTYLGTVVWRLDNVSSGAGQPLGTAVHADIEVPDDKLKVALTLQKNTDASLAASHTMTIVFTISADSPTGGIKQISVPQLRLDDSPTGNSLIGIPVPIMENSFLVGLSRGSAEATNLGLIKQRAWFDIPILLDNGRIAKLTFEKGTSGTRAIDDAIAAWQAP